MLERLCSPTGSEGAGLQDNAVDSNTIIYGTPNVETYISLRAATGFSPKTPKTAAIGLSNTLFGVQISPSSFPYTFTGMGRIIGDGGCFFQLVDVTVLPSHQGWGVRKMIMKELKTWMDKNVPESGTVLLFADGRAKELYGQYRFVETLDLTIQGWHGM